MGPRQRGKTTFIGQTLPAWRYLNLERMKCMEMLHLRMAVHASCP